MPIVTDPIEGVIAAWDGEYVVSRYQSDIDAWIFVAVHDTTLGPAAGGTRMKVYPTPADGLVDAMRLAEGMTYKWAGVGMDMGGGKAVLAPARPLDEAGLERLFARYGRVLDALGGAFRTGPDVGMGPERMARVARHTQWVVGAVDGDAPDPGVFTAHGVMAGIEAAVETVLGASSIAGVRILVQGLGDVGAPLVEELAAAGAELVLADIDADLARRTAARVGATVVDPDSVYDTTCDVYAPCALGATLNEGTIGRLRCRLVAGSANNQFATDADPNALHARGVVAVPDYILNAGGAYAVTRMSQGVRDPDSLMAEVEGIGPRVAEILADSAAAGVPPLDAAQRRVDRMLAERGSPRYQR